MKIVLDITDTRRKSGKLYCVMAEAICEGVKLDIYVELHTWLQPFVLIMECKSGFEYTGYLFDDYWDEDVFTDPDKLYNTRILFKGLMEEVVETFKTLKESK